MNWISYHLEAAGLAPQWPGHRTDIGNPDCLKKSVVELPKIAHIGSSTDDIELVTDPHIIIFLILKLCFLLGALPQIINIP